MSEPREKGHWLLEFIGGPCHGREIFVTEGIAQVEIPDFDRGGRIIYRVQTDANGKRYLG